MQDTAPGRQIARSATIVSIGNVLSRVMGLVREGVIADVFGASGALSAYTAASQVPFTLYEMLIGGLISSALIPTLSAYVADERRENLWRLTSLLFTLAALVLGLALLALEFVAPWVTTALVRFDGPLQTETTRLLRIVLVSVFFMGMSGMATAVCHTLQRFALPAFTSVIFNTSIVAAALLFGPSSGDVRVLAVGLVVGSALQVVLQLPALRGVRFRPTLDLKHPALRRILKLYLPVILSLVAASLGVLLDRNLASRTGELTMSWMRFATALIQFPLGLVSTAVSVATLPMLARQAAQESEMEGSAPFCHTLASGLRLVLFLTIPAAVGLLVLGRPLVALLFQHGGFGPEDTAQTTLALRTYLLGLVFAAIDQPLVYAFYARRDTWRPAMVGILSVGFYAVVALPTYRSLGMVGLILANGAQLSGHAVVMLWLFRRRVGTLRGHGIGRTLALSAAASVAMGLAVWGTLEGVEALLGSERRFAWAAAVLAGGGMGSASYLALSAWLKSPELQIVTDIVRPLLARVAPGLARRRGTR